MNRGKALQTWAYGKEEDVAHHAYHIQVLDPVVLEYARKEHDNAEHEHAYKTEQVKKAAALDFHQRNRNEGGEYQDEANEGSCVLDVLNPRLAQDFA